METVGVCVLTALLMTIGIQGLMDQTCRWQGGHCTVHPCGEGYYRQAGLCEGPAHRQCCVRLGLTGGDSACEARNGECQDTSIPCNKGHRGYYAEGLCDGPAKQCCLWQFGK